MYFPRNTALYLLTLLPTLSTTYRLTITLPPSPQQPTYNPSHLPASTHATLYKHAHTLQAPLTRRNTFEFHDLPEGSWLLTIYSRDWTFQPGRVDVNGSVEAVGVDGRQEGKRKVDAWQTFWGNEWGNKGEWWGGGVVGGGAGGAGGTGHGGEEVQDVRIEVRPRVRREYYTERAGCEFSPA